jgi:hypothetical protein
MNTLLDLDPATYKVSALHAPGRIWPETNCYTDIWIELLHAWGFEPHAALAFTVAIDFEGDQWTFFKPPFGDLYELFGLDVQELAVWRPLTDHIAEQLAHGRPVLVELDSYFLPDTAGTAYKREHVKSTVAVMGIDPAAREMAYFHNQGFYRVQGDDFDGLFRLAGTVDPGILPPFVEFVKCRCSAPEGRVLLSRSLRTLRHFAQRMPEKNPFGLFKSRFAADLPWLMDPSIPDLARFHAYSFATLRQFGACYELASSYISWLGSHGVQGLAPAGEAFLRIAQGAKALQFHFARALSRGKPLDLSPLDAMGESWESAAATLKAHES